MPQSSCNDSSLRTNSLRTCSILDITSFTPLLPSLSHHSFPSCKSFKQHTMYIHTRATKPRLRQFLTQRFSTCILATIILVSIHIFQILRTPVRTLLPDRSFIAFSVDDFGRWADSIPLFPDQSFLANHTSLQIANKDFWYARATTETRTDLLNLLTFFNRINHNVSFQQRAVLTPHFVVGGPDFQAMRETGCGIETSHAPQWDCQYRETLISEPGPTGLDQHPFHRGDLKPAYKALFKAGVWHPEYHGRSHFGVSKWLRLLRTDAKAQACFQNNLVCASDVTQLRSEFNSFSTKQDLREWLEQGVLAFSQFWGYRPSLISSPHNTWNNWLAQVVNELSFVGAELAEDQATYVSKPDNLSLHDRFRFDVFFPGFQCKDAIKDVENLLNARQRHSSRSWPNMLSSFDVFRSYRRAFSYTGSAGVHERFVSLMWHAQNAMSSTYSEDELNSYMGCVARVVKHVRKNVPGAVFVTGAELHQIRSRGWSVETWDDGIILRNYATASVDIRVPNMREIYAGREWDNDRLSVRQISGPTKDGQVLTTAVGRTLRLQPDSVYHLTR